MWISLIQYNINAFASAYRIGRSFCFLLEINAKTLNILSADRANVKLIKNASPVDGDTTRYRKLLRPTPQKIDIMSYKYSFREGQICRKTPTWTKTWIHTLRRPGYSPTLFLEIILISFWFLKTLAPTIIVPTWPRLKMFLEMKPAGRWYISRKRFGDPWPR